MDAFNKLPFALKILAVIGVLIGACIVGSCGLTAVVAAFAPPTPPQANRTQVVAPPQPTQQPEQPQPAVVAQPTAPTPPTSPLSPPTDVPPPAPELPPGYHAINQTWRLGCCEYTVTAATAQNRVGNDLVRESAEPGAMFVVMRFTETNLSDETVHAMGGNVQLHDHRGRHFDESSRVMTAIEMSENSQMLPELQPNVPHRGIAGFEVPVDALDGPIDFRFTERGLLGSDTETVRMLPSAGARETIRQRGH